MSLINSIFLPVIGKMCWNVSNGIGSFLTFEFGEPHFKVVREPYVNKSKNPKAIRHSKRRVVSIRGDWCLWIRECNWHYYQHNAFIANSESNKKELVQIAHDLEGQVLVSVKILNPGITVFDFDLGGRLETYPYREDNGATEPETQWHFFQPSGMVFSYGSNGKYQHQMGNTSLPNEWISITEYSDD